MALAELKEMLAKVPADQRSKPVIIVDSKTFTPEQLVREAEEGTKEGKLIMGAVIGILRKFNRVS